MPSPHNGVIIAANTRALFGNLFDLRPIDPLDLKGFSGGVPAWQVIAALDATSRFRANRDPVSAAFVGRDAELALVLDPLGDGRRRRGSAVSIVRRAGAR